MNERRRTAYTAREVGEIINANLYTVHDLLRTKRLRGFKLNTHWRITPEALAEFISQEGSDESHGDETGDI